VANRQMNGRWRLQLLVLFALLTTAGIGSILSWDLFVTQRLSIEAGQAASEDILAPNRIEYESAVLTQAEQRRALSEVTWVYDPLDRQVGREQVNLALQILGFVDSVRADPYASLELKRSYLKQITSVSMSPQVISDTLGFEEDEWSVVRTETRGVLARIMQDEIKSEQEASAQRRVRSLIALDLNERQTSVVDEIASALVRANRVYNPEATEAARQAALDSVPPQIRVIKENQIIVRSGEIVTDLDIEALDALGLLVIEIDWLSIGGLYLLALLLSVTLSVYLWYSEPGLLSYPHHLLLLLLLLLAFSFLVKWGASLAISQQYLLPVATLGMLATVLFGAPLGFASHFLICLVVVYVSGGETGLAAYHMAGGLVGIFSLRQVKRINSFTWAGSSVMLANVAVVVVFGLLDGEFDTLRTGQLVLAGVINGAFSTVATFGGYYLLGMAFNITTAIQLLDLARPTHPAMRELLLKAPGTYHHSIMVGNMAEQAAEAVGANALLARVGAFYHDLGKTVRPYFFTENQMDGTNPHDLLDPETSAQIVRSHTRDGLELATRYRLPRVIRAFITEHHGTSRIGYFYHRAVQEYGEDSVQVRDYQHEGPTPQSKETAIVMMADSCEAAVRSVRPHNDEELENLIHKIIGSKLSSGQLSDVPLTLREISVITSSFVDTLQGVFHPRVQYPEQALQSGNQQLPDTGEEPLLEAGEETSRADEQPPDEETSSVDSDEPVSAGAEEHPSDRDSDPS